jgi:hypothetical protein
MLILSTRWLKSKDFFSLFLVAITAKVSTADLLSLVNNVIAKPLLEALAAEINPLFVPELLACASTVLDDVPGILEPQYLDTLAKAVEAQLHELETRHRLRTENDEDATEVEIEEAREYDDQTYIGLSRLLRTVLKGDARKFPLAPLVPFVDRALTATENGDDAAKMWALRLLNDIVEFLGHGSAPIVKRYAAVFVEGLNSEGKSPPLLPTPCLKIQYK